MLLLPSPTTARHMSSGSTVCPCRRTASARMPTSSRAVGLGGRRARSVAGAPRVVDAAARGFGATVDGAAAGAEGAAVVAAIAEDTTGASPEGRANARQSTMTQRSSKAAAQAAAASARFCHRSCDLGEAAASGSSGNTRENWPRPKPTYRYDICHFDAGPGAAAERPMSKT